MKSKMTKMLLLLLFTLILSTVITFLGYFLTLKSHYNYSKNSPFECGFNPRLSNRLSFSLQFFMVSLIFIIFDMEIILLFPFYIFAFKIKNILFYKMFLIFIFFLLLGLLIEWNEQMLNWTI